jgi:NAD(P)-dependent dehydrogenase (short-subunit alcohol dehydrogenase family)
VREFDGKVAVVTGGASGIGLGMANKFAENGMKLVLADVEVPALEKAVAEFESRGVEVIGVPTDVGDEQAMDALGARTLDRFGAAHVVCNNAGVGGGGPMWELTRKDWDWVIRPNLWGVIHGVRVFGKHLVEQDEGHFVNTASMAGMISVAGMGPYNVTKHAVVTLSETLYGELQGIGSKVGVSVLCPGFVSTRIFESDRNRPEALQNDTEPEWTEEQEARREMAAEFMKTAMPTSQVADMVFDAIREQKLYILTHPNSPEAIRRRMEAIVEGRNPEVSLPDTFAAPSRD